GLEEIPEDLRTEFATIETDPELSAMQYKNLSQMEEMADTGLTAQEELDRQMTSRSTGAQAQARQKQILQQLAQQGQLGGGQQLAAQMMASQQAADRSSQEGLAQRAAAEQRRLAAIQSVGQQAGQMRGQEFQEKATKASAIDRFNAKNAANRQEIARRNLERRQGMEGQRTALSNQQEMYNKQLIGQDYQNRLNKAQAIAAARTGGAQTVLSGNQGMAKDTASMWGGVGQGLASLAGTAAQQGWGSNWGSGSSSTPKNNDMTYNYQPSSSGEMYAADGGKADKDDSFVGSGQALKTLQSIFGRKEDDEKKKKELPSCSDVDATKVACRTKYADGGDVDYMSNGSAEVVDSGMESYEGDRVDAQLNDGEVVINVPQQQRLVELLQGYRKLKDMGDEDIIIDKETGEAPAPMSGDTPPIDRGMPMPEEMDTMPPSSAPMDDIPPQFKDGGKAEKDYKYARGISEEYEKMCEQEEELKEATKATRKKTLH
ncbi:hypothetical protein, partial [Nocardia mangyaensis]|uniref:hypothetical protein n=1 Tax=Nocardia mangyaensis TaxID=2213200 RepID=UPI00267607FD